MASGSATFSVIGTDVVIKGDIEASADLHVDGTVQGDLVCASLVQGEASRIEGAITAESARLSGSVKGTINARELVILKTARVEGDVHYEALTVEHGAHIDGRFAPGISKASAPAGSAKAQPKPQAPEGDPGSDGEPRLTLAN